MFRILSSHHQENLTYISFVYKVYVHIIGSQPVYIFITAKYKTADQYVGNMWTKRVKIRESIQKPTTEVKNKPSKKYSVKF
jgi:hypothetical protein